MAADGVLTSPHRRPQGFSKAFVQNDLSCAVVIQRHQFLLRALVLLAFLCSVYLYFAVTLGDTESCFGLAGTDRELCRLKHAQESLTVGKLKFL